MATRISSQDIGYTVGQLSLYPETLDTEGQLYRATNNTVTVLKQSLTYSGKYIITEDNSRFPNNGIIRIGPAPGQSGPAEMIYYDVKKDNGVFQDIIRGFAGSRQNQWPAGSIVTNAVFAEHHNSIKDAIIQTENNLGTVNSPATGSLNQILKSQESRFLSPKALFRAYPTKGSPPLKIRFQNFSTGPIVRSLWDFGDGTTSIETSPVHTYTKEGVYTVKLNIITSLGSQGYATKSNYITVDSTLRQPFFYVSPTFGVSKETADARSISPTKFHFVDQTDGDIVQRWWIIPMPDGTINTIFEPNPNIHTLDYIFEKSGEYNITLLSLLANQTLQKAYINPGNVVGGGIVVE